MGEHDHAEVTDAGQHHAPPEPTMMIPVSWMRLAFPLGAGLILGGAGGTVGGIQIGSDPAPVAVVAPDSMSAEDVESMYEDVEREIRGMQFLICLLVAEHEIQTSECAPIR